MNFHNLPDLNTPIGSVEWIAEWMAERMAKWMAEWCSVRTLCVYPVNARSMLFLPMGLRLASSMSCCSCSGCCCSATEHCRWVRAHRWSRTGRCSWRSCCGVHRRSVRRRVRCCSDDLGSGQPVDSGCCACTPPYTNSNRKRPVLERREQWVRESNEGIRIKGGNQNQMKDLNQRDSNDDFVQVIWNCG